MTNREAEFIVLGDILYNNEIMPDIMDIVTPEDFSSVATQRYFQAMVYLYQDGQPIDPVSIMDMVDKLGKVPDLQEDIMEMINLGNPRSFANMIKTKARMR